MYGQGGECYYYRDHSCGTVFSITPSGAEKVLYSFDAYPDGAYPFAGLIAVKGSLYGTTETAGGHVCYGRRHNEACGTVFSITTGGIERFLYSFRSPRDGAYPFAGLINVKGKLYGTTMGGAYRCGSEGCGTVFRVTLGGKEKRLHNFGNGTDGARPLAVLIDVKGTLYGTTPGGGTHRDCGSNGGCGTVFSITPGGSERVLHSFDQGKGDGTNPHAGLLELNGRLYGTTYSGGAYGDGTVFSMTLSGREKLLHTFDGSDGSDPSSGLIDVGGTLYGTTYSGGAHGYGTVFSLKP